MRARPLHGLRKFGRTGARWRPKVSLCTRDCRCCEPPRLGKVARSWSDECEEAFLGPVYAPPNSWFRAASATVLCCGVPRSLLLLQPNRCRARELLEFADQLLQGNV